MQSKKPCAHVKESVSKKERQKETKKETKKVRRRKEGRKERNKETKKERKEGREKRQDRKIEKMGDSKDVQQNVNVMAIKEMKQKEVGDGEMHQLDHRGVIEITLLAL